MDFPIPNLLSLLARRKADLPQVGLARRVRPHSRVTQVGFPVQSRGLAVTGLVLALMPATFIAAQTPLYAVVAVATDAG